MTSGKRFTIALTTLVVLSLLLDIETGTNLIRHLAGLGAGITNVYTSVDDLHGIPELSLPSAEDVPLYLALCEEWIRQDALPEDAIFRAFKVVQEDQDVCLDWRAPHMSLLDMFSSMMISAYMNDTNYRPYCDRTRDNHGSFKLNFTTIQQVLGTFTLWHEVKIVSVETLKQQCKRCLLNYEPHIETTRIKSNGFHHCFAWPEDHDSTRNIDVKNIPHVPYQKNDLPMSAYIISIRQVSRCTVKMNQLFIIFGRPHLSVSLS